MVSVAPGVALVFDLDGTLVDSTYQHALAWSIALRDIDVTVPVWAIHRRVGMAGGLLANALAREIGFSLSDDELSRATAVHAEEFERLRPTVTSVRGAHDLLAALDEASVPWAIASSGTRDDTQTSLELVGVREDAVLLTSDDVDAPAKPDPEMFLAAAERLDVPSETCIVVGDAVWDVLAARRARMLTVGVLSGGFSAAELTEAGAFRVMADCEELRGSLDLIGVHTDVAKPSPR